MTFLDILIGLFIFCFGLVLGSFLNSYIYRLDHPSKRPRSFCPHCSHQLSFLDLVPVFSFVFLKGKCRYCRRKISWQYPLVELAAGFLFLGFFLLINRPGDATFFSIVSLIYYWLLSLLLIVIVVYDIKHLIILDKALFIAAVLTILHLALKTFWDKDIFIFLNSVIVAVLTAGFFFLIYFLSQGRWLGFGDVNLAFLVGLSLGFPNILPGLFFAFVVGAIIGMGFIIFQNKTLKSQIPFAPFLIAGQLFSIFFGNYAIQLYLNLVIL